MMIHIMNMYLRSLLRIVNMKRGISGDHKIILKRWNGLFLNYSEFIFLRLWIDLGAIELIDQVQPSFAFQAAFWSLSQFTVHGLKFQKVTEMIIEWLGPVDEW